MTDLSLEGQQPLPPEFMGNAMVRKVAEELGPSVTISEVARELHKQKVPAVLLPESIRPFVEELEKKAAEARAEADSPRGKSVDADSLFLAQTLAANNALAREGEKPHDASPTKNIQEMDKYEKFGYLNKLEDMSYEQFLKKSDAEQLKDIENIRKDGEERVARANLDNAKLKEQVLNDPNFGETREERQAALEKLSKTLDPNKIDRKEAQEIIDKLPPEQREIARQQYENNVQLYFGRNQIQKADQALDAHNRGDKRTEYDLTRDGAGDGRAASEKLEAYIQANKKLEELEMKESKSGLSATEMMEKDRLETFERSLQKTLESPEMMSKLSLDERRAFERLKNEDDEDNKPKELSAVKGEEIKVAAAPPAPARPPSIDIGGKLATPLNALLDDDDAAPAVAAAAPAVGQNRPQAAQGAGIT